MAVGSGKPQPPPTTICPTGKWPSLAGPRLEPLPGSPQPIRIAVSAAARGDWPDAPFLACAFVAGRAESICGDCWFYITKAESLRPPGRW